MSIDGLPIGVWAPSGLLGLTVTLILTGRLVPRATYKAMLEEQAHRLSDILSDRDKWREAHTLSEQARVLQTQSNARLLELAETTVEVVKALPREGAK